MSSIVYRPEVDGVRAIAVLAVIFYHAGFSAFKGGYIGVDVFFVISGYLITGIVVPEIRAGRFSVARFYERRVRRILPALFAVLLATTLAALVVLTPQQLQEYGQSLVAVNLFISNRYFYQKTGYFGANAEEVPLLHTWSLAIEEQFYVFFPLLLIALMRFWPRRVFWALGAMLVFSLALCLWRQHHHQATLSFFSLASRVWELSLGALLAVHREDRGPAHGGPRWAALGLAMVLVPVFTYGTDIDYPGWLTVLPVLGTGLLLRHAHPANRVGALLGSRPLVQMGLLSYSAYLWHQPLFAMSLHLMGTPPVGGLQIALILLTLVLAYLSWQFIETPFRNARRVGPRAIWTMAFLGTLALLAAGLAANHSDGFPSRFKSDFSQFDPINLPAENKHCRSIFPHFSANCLASRNVTKGEAVDLLILGDSHSQALAAGIIAKHPELRVIAIGRDGCPPFVGVERYDVREKINCNEAFEYLQKYPLRASKVLLAGRYSFYAEGSGFGHLDTVGRRPGSIHVQTEGSPARVNVPDYSEVLASGLRRTIGRFRGEADIYLFYQVPELGFDPKVCVEFGIRRRTDQNCTIPQSAVLARQNSYRAAFARVLAGYPDVKVVDPLTVLCDPENCFGRISGDMFYRNSDHLSVNGASYIFDKLFR